MLAREGQETWPSPKNPEDTQEDDTVEPDGIPSSHHAGPGAFRHRVNGIQREISELFFRLLESRNMGPRGSSLPRDATLKLSLDLAHPRSTSASSSSTSDQLYLQLERAVDRYAERSAAFPPGRVYCHWCRSFSCEHSLPPESRCVFGGYTATGQPRWPEFASVLLERRHPGIDSIFRDPPAPITLVQGGEELSSEQLPIYGKRSPIYRILGQATLGYLLMPETFRGEGLSRRSPLAVTFQVIEAGSDQAPLCLNIIGRLRDGTPAFQAIEESSDSRLASALLAARRAIDELSLLKSSRRRRHSERRRRVFAILHQLARNSDRIFRQRLRRTQHSQDRHLQRERPASSALKDALHAAPEAIYRDIEEKTWVVIGPKNRVHVFNDDALHVTSVVYPGETVRQRTTRGKWRSPPHAEMAAFQEALRRRAGPR